MSAARGRVSPGEFSFRNLLRTLGLLCRRRGALEDETRRQILDRFLRGAKHVVFYKSGRSALSAVFTGLAETHPGGVVLVPDYICNVVPRSVTRAGLKAVPYRTTDSFEADRGDLGAKLGEGSTVAVVLASIFGSQNTSAESVSWVRGVRADVLIVLDDCQNLLINSRPPLAGRTVLVFSFNMKTLLGAMGGGVCYDDAGLRLKVPSVRIWRDLRLELAVLMLYLNQLRQFLCLRRGRGWRPTHRPEPELEYSHAEGRVHYDMLPQRIARTSLARAIICMRGAADAEERRQRNHRELVEFLSRRGSGEVVPTTRGALAPFIAVKLRDRGLLSRHPWKGPYALEGDPHRSLRPGCVGYRSNLAEGVTDLLTQPAGPDAAAYP